jgi:Spy/CpxP family protein refolding chaperone
MRRLIMVVALVASSRLIAQGPPPASTPGGPGPGQPDPFGRFFFAPELVMAHQSEIGLQDAQRTAIQTAAQQATAKFSDAQWKLAAEGEKLAHLIQGASLDENQVLDQVDRVLALERDVKRAQVGLLIKIKNTLTPAQQAKLTEIRDRHAD